MVPARELRAPGSGSRGAFNSLTTAQAETPSLAAETWQAKLCFPPTGGSSRGPAFRALESLNQATGHISDVKTGRLSLVEGPVDWLSCDWGQVTPQMPLLEHRPLPPPAACLHAVWGLVAPLPLLWVSVVSGVRKTLGWVLQPPFLGFPPGACTKIAVTNPDSVTPLFSSVDVIQTRGCLWHWQVKPCSSGRGTLTV